MERVIGVNDLKDAGLLVDGYSESDLYDAFMMYLISNSTLGKDIIILHDKDYMLDSGSCFGMHNNWLV